MWFVRDRSAGRRWTNPGLNDEVREMREQLLLLWEGLDLSGGAHVYARQSQGNMWDISQQEKAIPLHLLISNVVYDNIIVV